MDSSQLLISTVAILLGGFLKGATGAGAPVIGVPILAAIFDIQFAVAVFAVINLISNVWHSFAYRMHRTSARLIYGFAVAGAAGAIAGSILLATLPTDILLVSLAVIVLAYIFLRLRRPDWCLDRPLGLKLMPYAGFAGGVMQGAGGISAPVSITFLSAIRLPRDEFIATISVFFVAMSIVQIPSLAYLGILTAERALLAVAATIPLFIALWAGERAAKLLSRESYDRIILILLAAISIRLVWLSVT